jgi:hypothetical protein
VGVLAFESVALWPVWSSSFGASCGQTFSACWLAVFLLSVSAGDWRVLNKSGWFAQSFWFDASTSVGSVADLNCWHF